MIRNSLRDFSSHLNANVARQSVCLALSVLLTGALVWDPLSPAHAAGNTYSLLSSVQVTPNNMVSISASNEDLRKVIYTLGQKSNLNLIMADSVVGKITIELNRVPISDAMSAIAAASGLDVISKGGNIYLFVDRKDAQTNGMERSYSKVVKINYANATRVSRLLNSTILMPSGSQGSGSAQSQKSLPDARTNSILLVGSPQEIAVAEQAIAQIDVPRLTKTFYLSNANAVNVAGLLASSVFNDGTAQLSIGAGGGGSGSSSGGSTTGGVQQPSTPTQITVEREKIQEGSGINNFGGQSGGGGSGGGTTAGLGQSITLRGMVKESTNISISPEGPIIIPDTRINAVTILGTAEQISLAESMIPIMDAQLPQASIEVSLVEITEAGTRELSTGIGLGQGNFQLGFNNSARAYNSAPSTIGIPTPGGNSSVGFTSSPVTNSKRFTAQIQALIQSQKAKVLANPTIVATHDSESVISIVDEIVRRTTVEQSSSINGLTTQQVEIGEAGIVLDILPKIGEDGTITMRLRPSVTAPQATTQLDAFDNTVTLLVKRDVLTQSVRVRDGETIVIGGLIQEGDSITKQKVPGLGDLPILGAMFRASSRTQNRSELVLMVTPHILNKTDLTPVNYSQTSFSH